MEDAMSAKQQLQNLQAFFDEGDRESEALLARADAALGHPMHWPVPPRTLPRWYELAKKRALRRAETWFGPLSQEDLDAFWQEGAKGQSVYEDAGGCMLRSYRALLALSTEEPYTYRRAVADITRARPAL